MDLEITPIVCVVGPTGTGKSTLGVQISQKFNGVVLSADSMQVYQGMNIGTAKLMQDEQGGVTHYLIDIVSLADEFTVAEWMTSATELIVKLDKTKRLPVIVGGTGLYIRALTDGLSLGGVKSDNDVREKWNAFLSHEGALKLHDELYVRDQKTASRLHVNDTRRIIRALELYELGSTMSESYAWIRKQGQFRSLQFGLDMPRALLYERLNRRVDIMIENGLIGEVTKYENELRNNKTAVQAIGYKEILEYIDGRLSLDEAIAQLKQNTRRFAKRQQSWFRRDNRIHWITIDEQGPTRQQCDDIFRRIQLFLQESSQDGANS